jgi:large subunit ribosomal protein L21
VYAIVRAGGRQEKVAVGDVLEVDRLAGAPGDTVRLPALLVVDGDDVTTDAAALASVAVTAEIVAAAKGPKITILKYKNKSGYRKRQGHRQRLTQVKVTAIDTPGGKAAPAKRTASKRTTAKATATDQVQADEAQADQATADQAATE